MFNKLSPTPITNQTHRRLLIFSMIWFFSWERGLIQNAHTYLIDDIETFFTPWHGGTLLRICFFRFSCHVYKKIK